MFVGNKAVPHTVLPRKLICQIEGETFELSSSALPSRAESLVVLGEAGMGKTTLLREVAKHAGFKFVTAARLIATRDPKVLIGSAEIAVIDALDEATATREGEAVDRVLAALEAANSPRFILACRLADWRSATATERISEVYGKNPLELKIRPLDAKQASEFLADSVGKTRAEEVVNHFVERELGDWLGNPQTLLMIEPKFGGCLFWQLRRIGHYQGHDTVFLSLFGSPCG